MSPRGVPKDKTPAVVEEQPLGVDADAVPEEDQLATEAESLQEFNEHIQSLVKHFVQQEVGERLEDLERIVGVLVGKTGADVVDEATTPAEISSWARAKDDGIPDYKQEHQGGDGIGWYTG